MIRACKTAREILGFRVFWPELLLELEKRRDCSGCERLFLYVVERVGDPAPEALSITSHSARISGIPKDIFQRSTARGTSGDPYQLLFGSGSDISHAHSRAARHEL